MIANLTRLFKNSYRHLNWIEISKSQLLDNYQYLNNLKIGLRTAPVLKSNAYGHGISLIAQTLDYLHPPFFCVDSLYEAYLLQRYNLTTPILIMGYTNPANFTIKKLPFTFVISDITSAKILNKFQKGANIHLKIDTGMHRLGVLPQNLEQFLKSLQKLKNLQVDGVMSHFAQGGSVNSLFIKQADNFQLAKRMIVAHGFKPTWYHISASTTLLCPETRLIVSNISNMARVGRALYGTGIGIDKNIKPILKLISTLAQVKTIKKGERVGYDGTYKANKNLTIGILPIGYFDGVDRRLSNKGIIYISNKPCPIIGRVSMNMITVDLSQVKNPKIGQPALIISDDLRHLNSTSQVSRICGTIEHDILSSLNSSIKRMVV